MYLMKTSPQRKLTRRYIENCIFHIFNFVYTFFCPFNSWICCTNTHLWKSLKSKTYKMQQIRVHFEYAWATSSKIESLFCRLFPIIFYVYTDICLIIFCYVVLWKHVKRVFWRNKKLFFKLGGYLGYDVTRKDTFEDWAFTEIHFCLKRVLRFAILREFCSFDSTWKFKTLKQVS